MAVSGNQLTNDFSSYKDTEGPGNGSYLGKYHTRIMIGKFQRQTPFNTPKFEPKIIVFLPIPSELRDETPVGYTNEPLETVGDIINAAGAAGLGAAGLRFAGDIFGGVAGFTAGAIGARAGAAAGGSKAVETAIRTGLTGVTSGLLPTDKITSAIQQIAQVAPNPNPSVQFQGPVLRDFSYTWAFYPKSKEESLSIKNLITVLKRSALPRNSFEKSAAILDYPDMCQVNFFPWDKGGVDQYGWSKDSIIKYKKCVMQNVSVNYNPFGTPAFFEGTNLPVSYQLTIAFKEIEYMLSNDWETATLPALAKPEPNEFGKVLGRLAPFTGAGRDPKITEVPETAEYTAKAAIAAGAAR